MSELKQRIEELFQAALELDSPDQRASFLDRECAGEPALRAEVEEFLRAAEAAEAVFRPHELAREVERVELGETIQERPGSVIGRYKLLEQIGEGGMGIVYMAEQQEPVRRRVAFKIIKPGMDTRQVVARFEAERQALALMDHPNIAKVLDGGATDTGRPYFVMELVHGIPITRFCAQNEYSTKDRLRLFIAVCHAIQHAHQKGIIHRDLKPTNILVTLHDGVPVPKVIDFGIAKATEGRLTDATVYTQLHQFIGTPAYMSPEQAEMSGLDIDTRSDIYSLGVLVYELLTGKTPFDANELLSQGIDAMRKTIREQEPPRPSLRLATLQGGELTTTAKRRSIEVPRLIRLMKGDLDWVVMKCLEKDRTRRYETANGLASDIRRHLNNEPVVARPSSKLYELQKTVRRHKVGFAATAAVIAALTVGITLSTWGLIHYKRGQQAEARLRERAEADLNLRNASALMETGKCVQAEELLDQIPPRLRMVGNTYAKLRGDLAWQYALRGEWAGAARNYRAIKDVDVSYWLNHEFEYKQEDSAFDLFYAPTLIEASDKSGYEEFRLAEIARCRGSQNLVVAERVCRLTLLLPANKEVVGGLGRLYDLAARAQETEADRFEACWACVALAMVDYRRGDYTKATAWCDQVLSSPVRGFNPFIVPMTRVILAMAQFQMNQPAEAHKELAQARKPIEASLPKPDGPGRTALPADVDYYRLFDWAYARIILREAESLLAGSLPAHEAESKGKSATHQP